MTKSDFIEKWGSFVVLTDEGIICTSKHAKRRWSTALEIDASKLTPPQKVTYDAE
ncbi:hypothetical protein [Photobacterium damselae]|uniref:hypothetical protein n=1 Tax=Photobacterium damselae TaxID=38293 RepID=UPI001F1BBD90|nr:hypothetical protein [Photobacterium damselae]UKA04858.1 hypothetical protein IHC89_21685 [Photobacterium damselae subsp. damselae]